MTEIRLANERDREFWFALDKHIAAAELEKKLRESECYVLVADGVPAGILRYNLFWDNTPFCTLLVVADGMRGRGYGSALMRRWERDMTARGYRTALTSSQSDEEAQGFYRRLGYSDCGYLLADEKAAELFFKKSLACDDN